jgi:hypothetical protein
MGATTLLPFLAGAAAVFAPLWVPAGADCFFSVGFCSVLEAMMTLE